MDKNSFILDLSKLEAGDIILSRSESRESILIRTLSGSDYSHAMLYVGLSSGIESDGNGVNSLNIQRRLYDNILDVKVYRLKKGRKNGTIRQVINYARQMVGMEYSTKEARLSISNTNNPADEPNRQFCTRFVAKSFEAAGLLIVENPDYCTPQNIIDSSKLIEVQNVVVTANDNQIEFALSPNPIEKQTEISNNLFESVRNYTKKDIQTIEQLFQYMLDCPEEDDKISKILEESDYLTMWKWDIVKNPWYYDVAEFLKHFKDPIQRKDLAEFFAESEAETRDRFIRSLESVKHCYTFHHQNFFKLLIELYEKLIQLSLSRENVGKIILSGSYNL
jgi:hypothetical protein